MPRISRGWYLVAVAALSYLLVMGATFSAFGLYVLPVSKELHLSRADMNSVLILFNLGVAVTAPFLGRALDRFSARRIMMLCSVLLALSLATLGLSTSLWLSAAVLALPLALAYQGAGTVTMPVFLARWFEAYRGRAMALAFMGASGGAIVSAPVMGLLIEALGWRTTLVLSGAVAGAVLLLLSFTLRDRPVAAEVDFGRGAPDSRSQPGAPAAAPAKVGALLRMPLFWMTALSVAMSLAMTQAISISLVPLGQDAGLTVIQAASLISAAAATGLTGKLLLALLDGKFERIWLLTALFVLAIVADAGLMFANTYAALLACSAIVGLVGGAVTPAYLALLADRFGSASFGTVQGLVRLAGSTLALATTRLAGEVFDRTGGYDALFAGFVIFQAVAAALMIATRFAPPVKAATVEGAA